MKISTDHGFAARGKNPTAFDRRCIPPDCVARRSNIPAIPAPLALSAGRLAGLGATRDFCRGLLVPAALAATALLPASGSAQDVPAAETVIVSGEAEPDGLAQAPEERDAPPPQSDLDGIAEEYVYLVLAMGEHDADYVDAYFGPPDWAETAPERFPTPDVIRDSAEDLLDRLRALERPEEGIEARRATALENLLISMTARIDVISGVDLSFDEETRLVFGVVAPDYEEAHFEAILAQLDTLLPGEGDLNARAAAFRQGFVIPPERLPAVFDAAIAECRRRTMEHIELPSGEDFVLEYVTDKPWSGYNWFRGNAFSLIQINTDLPRHIDRAIDLGCHEGYPGHHTYGSLTERELYRGRGWVEFSVYPLFSPTALLSEGSANYGIDLAFPGEERIAYEVATLYPLAGLDPNPAERYNLYLQLRAQLGYARIEAARDYLDGRITRAQAVDWLRRLQLMSGEEAEQALDFIETYGAYVINYSLGQDLVRAYIEEQAGGDPERRWQLFEQLLSEPFSVTELGSD